MRGRTNPDPRRVAQAIGIYRSVVACHERVARNDDIHALTAMLMLPCYQADFVRLARTLTLGEEIELKAALRRIRQGCAEAVPG